MRLKALSYRLNHPTAIYSSRLKSINVYYKCSACYLFARYFNRVLCIHLQLCQVHIALGPNVTSVVQHSKRIEGQNQQSMLLCVVIRGILTVSNIEDIASGGPPNIGYRPKCHQSEEVDRVFGIVILHRYLYRMSKREMVISRYQVAYLSVCLNVPNYSISSKRNESLYDYRQYPLKTSEATVRFQITRLDSRNLGRETCEAESKHNQERIRLEIPRFEKGKAYELLVLRINTLLAQRCTRILKFVWLGECM